MDGHKAAKTEKKNTFRNKQKETYQLRRNQFHEEIIQPLKKKTDDFIDEDLDEIMAKMTEKVSGEVIFSQCLVCVLCSLRMSLRFLVSFGLLE